MNIKRNFLSGLLLLSVSTCFTLSVNASTNNTWNTNIAVQTSPLPQQIAPSGIPFSPQYLESVGGAQQLTAPTAGQAAAAISTPLVLLSGFQALYYYIRNILSQVTDPTALSTYQQFLATVNADATIVFNAYSGNTYAAMNVAPAATDKNFASYVSGYNSLYQNIADTTAYFNGGTTNPGQRPAGLNIAATVNSLPLLVQNINAIEAYLYNNSATITATTQPAIYQLFQKASSDAQYISYYANVLSTATAANPAPASTPNVNSLYQLYAYLATRMQNIAAQVTTALTPPPAPGS